MKLFSPHAFWPVVMATVMVIIIATWQAIRASSSGDVVLMWLVGLRHIRFGEIIDV